MRCLTVIVSDVNGAFAVAKSDLLEHMIRLVMSPTAHVSASSIEQLENLVCIYALLA